MSATFVVIGADQYGSETFGELSFASVEEAEKARREEADDLRALGWQWDGENGVFVLGSEWVCLEVRDENEDVVESEGER